MDRMVPVGKDEFYFSIFEDSHIVMLLIEPSSGLILDANLAACDFYGYSRYEMKGKAINQINILSQEEIESEMGLALSQKRKKFYFRHRLASGEVRDVEVYSGPVRYQGSEALYSVVHDITERRLAQKQLEVSQNKRYRTLFKDAQKHAKMLEGVLQGVTVIVGVYRPDHSIILYNQAGYNYFNVTKEEVMGKRCYEIMGRSRPCQICATQEAISKQEMVSLEKFVPEMDKFIDCKANPVYNEMGEVMFVVEQLRDITAEKLAKQALLESEDRFRRLFEMSPDAVVIQRDGKYIMANQAAADALGWDTPDMLIGREVLSIVHRDYRQKAQHRITQILAQGISKEPTNYKLIRSDGNTIDVELASGLLLLDGKPAVQVVFRDITKHKQDMEMAAAIMRGRLSRVFPLPAKAEMESLYKPAKNIGGDFFCLEKLDESTVIGLLGDVQGNGISAALSTTAVKVLFFEQGYDSPVDILQHLNREVPKFLGEEYVAACCFKIDFNNMLLEIAGAGINKFAISRREDFWEELLVPGPFLGMFEKENFSKMELSINQNDILYFYTDGYGELLHDKRVTEGLYKGRCLKSQREYIETVISEGEPEDDCTWMALRML